MKNQTIQHLLRELEINITNNTNSKQTGQIEKSFERKREIGRIKEEIKRRCQDDK